MEQKFQQIGTEIERFRLECIYMERKNDRLPIFTERFRELQEDRSNTEFADFLGISRQTVGFYCNGDRVPDALTLIKIAQKCQVSTDWLLGLTSDIDRRPTATEDLGLSYEAIVAIKHFDDYEKRIFSEFITCSAFGDLLLALTTIYQGSYLYHTNESLSKINHELVHETEKYVRKKLGTADAVVIYGDELTELLSFKANGTLNAFISGLVERGKLDTELETEERNK